MFRRHHIIEFSALVNFFAFIFTRVGLIESALDKLVLEEGLLYIQRNELINPLEPKLV
jgi:hypothetical protein